jgi:hypothetical protein
VLLEGSVQEETGEAAFRLYRLDGGVWVDSRVEAITKSSLAYANTTAQRSVQMPVSFGDVAELQGFELAGDRIAPGDEIRLTLYWKAFGPVYQPLSSFTHLVDEQDRVVAQYDGFDVPPRYWKPGLLVAQLYRFAVDEGVPQGHYWLEIGLYDPQSMERIVPAIAAGDGRADRLVLSEITVVKPISE